MQTKQTKTEIGFKCGYCPKVIFKSDEPRGKLVKKDGKHICVLCRIKLGKKWTEIENNKDNYEKDVQRKENDRIKTVAYVSQVVTKTDFNNQKLKHDKDK